MILSVPEGHDKPLKYPLIFTVCDALLINKIDVLPYFDFDMDKVTEYAHMRNPDIKIFPICAKTGEGMDAFIGVFTGAYKKEIGGEMTAGTMSLLTGEQHSLLAYQIFRDEVMEGGFCQLIQNGYGGYIFDNPFAKVMRLWGVGDLSKLVYAAKKIYDSHRDDLERERTDEEFMAMYEQYEAFDELEDEFLEKEEEYTALVAGYVDEHLELFAKIV